MRNGWLAVAFCVLVTPAFAESLKEIKIVADRAPDCSSLDSIVKTVTRDCKTEDAKLIAIYNFCRYVYYHLAYPNEKGGVSALKMMNVYGWGLCGGQHSVLAAVWEKAGYKWRYRGWPGHTTVEVYYGDRWHYFDTFLKFFVWMQTGAGWTVAGQQDIKANPALVSDSFVMDPARNVAYLKNDRFDWIGDKANWPALAFMVCGDELPGVIAGCKANTDAGSPRGWASVQVDGDGYSTDVSLAPGYALDLTWDKVPGAHYFNNQPKPPAHTCGDKDYRNCPVIGPLFEPYLAKSRARSYTNGTLVFRVDLGKITDASFLKDLKQVDNVACEDGVLEPAKAGQPGVLVIPMASPYVVSKASGKVASVGEVRAEVSRDGKAWSPISLDDFTKEVYGAYSYSVRLTFQKPITALELTSTVQHNAPALPYLSPGHNVITVAAANPDALGKNRLAVTYAYQPGFRSRTYESLLQEGAEVGRAHGAQWPETPVVVQRIVDKFPCTFEIDVPTPKGKQPVYPRMLFLRREVLAPGQDPMPTPAPPMTPKVGENDTLATLPVPWLMGTQRAEPKPARPTQATTLPLRSQLYANLRGEVFAHNFIKWLKDNTNAWILLLAFDPEKLPDPKAIANAKLVFYVIEAHDKADMQAGAVALKAPFEPGKPYDFANLGATINVTAVAKGAGPGAPFNPPRRYEIDVTREVMAWARDKKANGLALRIVPNRAIDEGWTVRFTPAKEKPAELEIATFGEK